MESNCRHVAKLIPLKLTSGSTMSRSHEKFSPSNAAGDFLCGDRNSAAHSAATRQLSQSTAISKSAGLSAPTAAEALSRATNSTATRAQSTVRTMRTTRAITKSRCPKVSASTARHWKSTARLTTRATSSSPSRTIPMKNISRARLITTTAPKPAPLATTRPLRLSRSTPIST